MVVAAAADVASVVRAFEDVIPGATLDDDLVSRFVKICLIAAWVRINSRSTGSVRAQRKDRRRCAQLQHVQRLAESISRASKSVKKEREVYTRDTIRNLKKKRARYVHPAFL